MHTQPGKTHSAAKLLATPTALTQHPWHHPPANLTLWSCCGAGEKEGASLPPSPSSKPVVHLWLSFETHLGVEQRKAFFRRRKQECNTNRKISPGAELWSPCWSAVHHSGVHMHCAAWPHRISVLGTPCASALASQQVKHPDCTSRVKQKYRNRSTPRDCFHLLP